MASSLNDDEIREYANQIRKRLVRNKASIRHYLTKANQHFWIVSRDDISISVHGKTPGEALDSFEEKLKERLSV